MRGGLNKRKPTKCHIEVLLMEALGTARPGAGLLPLHGPMRTRAELLHSLNTCGVLTGLYAAIHPWHL